MTGRIETAGPNSERELATTGLVAARERARATLSAAVDTDGAVRRPCASRTLETTLLLVLLRKRDCHPEQERELTAFLTTPRAQASGYDAALAQAVLHGRTTGTDVVSGELLAGFDHFSLARKRLLFDVYLAVAGAVPFDASMLRPSRAAGPGGSEDSNAKSGAGEDTKTKAAANGATKTGGKVTFCKTEDLAIDARDAAPDKDSGRIDITMINRGSTTCSATGFAGVDIKDADNTSNPIERGHAQPRITTLEPGDAAVFNLAYDIDNTGNSLASPTNILVTPPNETHTVSLKWPAGAGEIKGAYTDVEVYPTHTTK
ncbi:DUF4232 domain-containing protein [Streptomyces sp. NPDC032161]|uniref:DUF4232 domain-containing protein n=1 Tax=unclassified Streptomyces TaxID=2593676 RepID=UPI0033C5250B